MRRLNLKKMYVFPFLYARTPILPDASRLYPDHHPCVAPSLPFPCPSLWPEEAMRNKKRKKENSCPLRASFRRGKIHFALCIVSSV